MIAPQQTIALADTLAQVPIFKGECRELLDVLVARCSLQHVAPDTPLLNPRQASDRAYVILQGQVEVRLGRHAERAIATLGPGQCIGEMSVIEDVAPSATVVSLSACTVVAIEGAALRELLEHSRVLARNLLRILARRLRKDNTLVRQSLERQAVSELHARLDPLTGLFNRRWLEETLPEVFQRHRAEGAPLTLMMLDIDQFKSFNDLHGHLAGDQVLSRVANLLQLHIRGGDEAVRFGGEEFLVILPETTTATAQGIATRLRETIGLLALCDRAGTPLPTVSASIGLAESLPGESVESLLARTDAALYQAKQAGRNRVVVDVPGSPVATPQAVPRLRRVPPQA
ncbi:MAG: diguanylate cyclase [Gammaproteobacteria bacterium]